MDSTYLLEIVGLSGPIGRVTTDPRRDRRRVSAAPGHFCVQMEISCIAKSVGTAFKLNVNIFLGEANVVRSFKLNKVFFFVVFFILRLP